MNKMIHNLYIKILGTVKPTIRSGYAATHERSERARIDKNGKYDIQNIDVQNNSWYHKHQASEL